MPSAPQKRAEGRVACSSVVCMTRHPKSRAQHVCVRGATSVCLISVWVRQIMTGRVASIEPIVRARSSDHKRMHTRIRTKHIPSRTNASTCTHMLALSLASRHMFRHGHKHTQTQTLVSDMSQPLPLQCLTMCVSTTSCVPQLTVCRGWHPRTNLLSQSSARILRRLFA